ncbi:YjaG family protein [Algibacillus agarilyticus]|uniref:YjaG family protein n=1 Tax=Algibacillus agarilyticus TaxID=2234133 RepID=UPI000DCF976E|nr:DUF416 family protein [Algibacillus agarilyticus]
MSKPSTFARIRDLNRRQLTAFNAMLLERMLPNYNLYAELTEEGDASILRKALDVIWQQVYDAKTKINLELRQEKIEEQIPVASESDSIGLYAAVDAGMAIIATLAIMDTPADEANKEVTYPSLLSQGTVERLLIMNGEVEHSKAALEHPHMQWEIETQNEFLDEVEKITKFDSSICRTLQTFALAEGVSNLGIEIEL